MHSSRSRQIAVRRHTAALQPHCVMLLTVETSTITDLRQLVMRCCGDTMEFMRVALCADTRKSRVWLCISPTMAMPVMDLILRTLPAAEFGPMKQQAIQ